MNDRSDNPAATTIDPEVSVNYRLIAGETAPAELNRQVLQKAENALRSQRRQYSMMRWLRPVGFIATAGLSLAVFLELNESGIVAPPTITSTDNQQQGVAPPMPAAVADDAVEKRSAAETANALRREKSVSAVSSKLAAPAAEKSEDVAEPIASRQQAAPAADTTRRCSDAQRADANEWWRCVLSLRRAGTDEIAAFEFDSLQKIYPDFVPPE